MKKVFLLVLLAFCFCAFHANEACAKKVGAWVIRKHIDEMDDSLTITATTTSKSVCRFHGIDYYPKLAFAVNDKDGFSICIIYDLPLMGVQEDIDITYRADKDVAQNSSGWDSKHKQVTTANPEKFARDLYGHKKLLVRVSNLLGDIHTIKFDITGAKDALKDIAKAAGWK